MLLTAPILIGVPDPPLELELELELFELFELEPLEPELLDPQAARTTARAMALTATRTARLGTNRALISLSS
jgi:hypothetical protein